MTNMNQSKINISLEIDKKIDQLIFKNIQKGLVVIKINADMSINKCVIGIFSLLILFLCIIYFKAHLPSWISNSIIYSMLLLPIPALIFKILMEFKNSYLKYSNQLA